MDGSKTQIEFDTTQSYYWSFLLSSSFVFAGLLEIIALRFTIIIIIITLYEVRLFAPTIIVILLSYTKIRIGSSLIILYTIYLLIIFKIINYN